MTSVRFKLDCEETCTAVHSQASAKRHKEVPLKRLKSQIDEFLSEDDWLWQQAITIDSRLQEIVTSIQKLRKEMMQKVYEKKLAYALQWDTADNIATSFKLARDGKFQQLTCANIFRINEKLEKGRKFENKEIMRLTKEIINDTKMGVNAIVERGFQGEAGKKKRYEKQDERDPRDVEEEILGYAKGKQPKKKETTPEQIKRAVQPQFSNSLPTVKINQIEQISTSFNIIIKVLRIVKYFDINRVNRVKRVQFVGGDQTGIATLVLDESRSIRRNNVISISRARIYLFKGTIKQIQDTDKGEDASIVKELDYDIEVDEDGFNLSGIRREEKVYNRPHWVDREKRNEREDRPERQVRRRGGRMKESDDEEEPQSMRTTRRPRYEPKEQPKVEPTRPNRRHERSNRCDSDEDEQPERTKQSKQDMYSNKKNSEPSVQSSRFNINKKDSSSEQQKPVFKKEESQKTTPASSVPFQATKIANIEPGDQKLNLIAEVLQIKKKGILGIKQAANYVHCIVGDDTGISRIQLPKNLPSVKLGAVLKMTCVNADVDTDHRITLKLDEKEGLCERTTIRMSKVNKEFSLWAEIWESEEEDEPIIEDF